MATDYRSDIDGLRAIAVLTVVLYHYFPALCPGGYVGVDVFFVISGFLITDLLQKRSLLNKLDIVDFWARRIRRIFPSLLVMFLVTSILAHFVLYQKEARDFSESLLYASLFWTNMFLHSHSGYFDVASDLRANLHLWSLAVEEQFYFFWPFIIAFLPPGLRRQIVLFLFLGSLVYSVVSMQYWPNDAFYLLPSRLWELAAGGLLALFSTKLNLNPWRNGLAKFNCKFEDLLSVGGLALLLLASFGYSRETAFPGWHALVPVLATCLLIRAGPTAIINRTLLSRDFFVGIGLISYPLYLWHWVLLYFVNVTANLEPALWEKMAALTLSFLAATLCYQYVERPIRKASRPWSSATWLLLVSNFAIAGWAYCSGDLHGQSYSNPKMYAYWEGMLAQEGKKSSFDHCPFTSEQTKYSRFCKTSSENSVNAILIGDSHSEALFPGIVNTVKNPTQWALLGRSSCPPLLYVHDPDSECRAFNLSLVKTLKEHSEIKTVVVAAAARMLDKGSGRNLRGETNFSRLSPAKTIRGLVHFMNAIKAPGRKIVFMMDAPPISSAPKYCGPRPVSLHHESPQHCSLSRADYLAMTKNYRKIVQAVKLQVPNLIVFDPTNIFCSNESCSVFQNGVSYYSYSDHMSDTSSALEWQSLLKEHPEINE